MVDCRDDDKVLGAVVLAVVLVAVVPEQPGDEIGRIGGCNHNIGVFGLRWNVANTVSLEKEKTHGDQND